MKTLRYEQFKHGQRVACKIEGVQSNDAKISIGADKSIYICHNLSDGDGASADDKLHYRFSWKIFHRDKNMCNDHYKVTDLVFLDRPIEDVQEGDIIDYKGARQAKVLGRCGEVIFLSKTNCHSLYGQALTIEQLKETGCTIKQDNTPTITEVTLQEVADKMGIPVEQLRIKE